MNRTRLPYIGIIAEDESDYISIRVLIQRIVNNENIVMKKFVGKGCGKIKRKCNAWANQFKEKGCSVLLLIHDLDSNNIDDLRAKLNQALSPSPIEKHLICIPIQELEAWFLSDPDAIKKGMNLKKMPNVKGNPEYINSPKEHLERVIDIASSGEKIYIHTKHNEKIAKLISFHKAKKCKSFTLFYDLSGSRI